MSPAERASADPHFHMLVRFFADLGWREASTGSTVLLEGVIEASGYAWQLYTERHSPLEFVDGVGRHVRSS